ncbi:unnamed protein product [Rotaria socialis]|uniref:Uncharacterized protein n=1 Tax=Rotaria socialis TaxID=392032 RepID=A0A821KYA6_9BILA|nr:unnamed protein product [Rotaria socialis]
MHISLVLLFCVFIVAINAAATNITGRVDQVNAVHLTPKAAVGKSPYDYLRAVSGKTSCTTGPCPFWERHGRSFVSLRCYEQQYKECTCLHRLCFKSCMFKRETCNQEMASCLRQICPRCLPASQLAICKIYDSTVGQVAKALSKFTCYSSCPMLMNNSTNNKPTAKPGTTTRKLATTTQPPINNMRPIENGMATIRTNQAGRPKNAVASKIGNKPNSAAPMNTNVPGNNSPVLGARPGNTLPNTIDNIINANRAPQIPRQETEKYVPSSRGARGIYRSSYVRPTGGYRAPLRPRGGYRPPLRPVVPAGSGPGGAGLLAAILGPIGGLTGCLCCLNTIGIWGLFITAIPLTVFISKWLQAFKSRNGQNGAEELVAPHMLLLIVLVSAALGPVGGLAACACCLLLAAIWGLFATTIALAVFTKQWVSAVRTANSISGGGVQMVFSHALLIGILCLYGYIGIRRTIRSAN